MNWRYVEVWRWKWLKADSRNCKDIPSQGKSHWEGFWNGLCCGLWTRTQSGNFSFNQNSAAVGTITMPTGSDTQPTRAAFISLPRTHCTDFTSPLVHSATHFSHFHTHAFSSLYSLVSIGLLTFCCTFANAALVLSSLIKRFVNY